MKRKIMYNRWKVSSEEIKKHQDFKAILKKVEYDSSWQWKSIGFWGTVGTTAVALFFLVIHF
ncbi:MAG TPA: hypothetical protein VFD77_02815 [Brumimicrobium sp.]|nr:hypothetical protein [Brumimicrobium sp.]